MKRIKSILILLLMATGQLYAQTPTIGDFSLYQTLSRSNVVSYFGTPSTETATGKGAENGQEVTESRYWYTTEGNSYFNISFINYSGRISRVVINKRDANYAINGILMIGDLISKISELGYNTSNNYTEYKYIEVSLPTYIKNEVNFYYHLRINYDDNEVITAIFLEESTGI